MYNTQVYIYTKIDGNRNIEMFYKLYLTNQMLNN